MTRAQRNILCALVECASDYERSCAGHPDRESPPKARRDAMAGLNVIVARANVAEDLRELAYALDCGGGI